MAIKVKSGGAYADITGVFHKRAGAYEAVQGVFVKAGGVYGRVDAAPLVPDTYVASYASYATGLAAVAEGEYFAAPIDTYRAGVWQKVSSHGNMVGVQPVDTGLGLIRPQINALGDLPGSPLVDVDSIDSLWSLQEVRNRVSGAPTPEINYFWNWNGSRIWSNIGGISSTENVSDSLGGTSAARFVHSAGAAADSRVYLPCDVHPGRWTFQFDAYVTGGGADQTWRIGGNDLTGSTAITVTAVKQTFSVTITRTIQDFRAFAIIQGSYPSVAAAAGDITVENVKLIAGSVDATAYSSAVRIGHWKRAQARTYTGQVFSGADTDNAIGARLASTQSFTSYTLAVVGSLAATSTSGAIVSGVTTTSTRTAYSGYLESTNNSQAMDRLIIANGGSNNPMMKATNQGAQVYVLRFTGSGISFFVDGRLLESTADTSPISSVRFLSLLGAINNVTSVDFPLQGLLSGSVFWNSALSDADILTATIKLKQRAAIKSLPVTTPVYMVYAEGDSITAGSGDTINFGGHTSRASSIMTGISGTYRNDAVISATLEGANSLMNRLPTVQAACSAYLAAGTTPIFVALIGANDAALITSQTEADTYYTTLKSYMTTVRATGAKTVLCTMLPINNGSNAFDRNSVTIVGGPLDGNSYNGLRNYIRARILLDAADFDGVADYAGNAAFTSWSATYIPDNVHPNELGHSIMAGVLQPVLQSIADAL